MDEKQFGALVFGLNEIYWVELGEEETQRLKKKNQRCRRHWNQFQAFAAIWHKLL